jgi:hypothetical protein
MRAHTTIGKTKMLLRSAALSAGAVLATAGPASAKEPAQEVQRVTDMKGENGVLMCRVGNSKAPKYAACTREQIEKNAHAEAAALLAAKPEAASLPPEVRYVACKLGNSKGPAYDGACLTTMDAVYQKKKSAR